MRGDGGGVRDHGSDGGRADPGEDGAEAWRVDPYLLVPPHMPPPRVDPYLPVPPHMQVTRPDAGGARRRTRYGRAELAVAMVLSLLTLAALFLTALAWAFATTAMVRDVGEVLSMRPVHPGPVVSPGADALGLFLLGTTVGWRAGVWMVWLFLLTLWWVEPLRFEDLTRPLRWLVRWFREWFRRASGW